MKKNTWKKFKMERKNITIISLFIITILIIFLLFNLSTFLKSKEDSSIIIEKIKSFEYSKEKDLIIVSVANNNTIPGDCSLDLTLPDKSFNIDLGIINPSQKRIGKIFVRFKNGETNVIFKAQCKWLEKELIKDYDLPKCNLLTKDECDLIQKDIQAEQCINRAPNNKNLCFAIVSGDSNYCDYINSELERIECISLVTNNLSLCEQLEEEEKDGCYFNYGLNKRDKEICEKIINLDKKNSCLGVATKNPELCNKVDESYKFICIVNIAEIIKNKGLCELLTNKQDCYDELEWLE